MTLKNQTNYPFKNKIVKITTYTFIIVSILTCFTIFKHRYFIYNYDVTNNYIYNFTKSISYTLSPNFSYHNLSIGSLPKGTDTAILQISVQTSLTGFFFEPSIEVIAGNSKSLHFFEHGAQGTRFLDISRIATKHHDILIKCKNIKLIDSKTNLFLFQNQILSDSKILIIAPHPDDAEIAAFGVYNTKKDSFILTITAGDAGLKKYDEIFQDETAHFLKKGELRFWNSITVPLLAGIKPENVYNLGYFDEKIYDMFLDKSMNIQSQHTHLSDINYFRKNNFTNFISSTDISSSWKSLVQDLQNIVKKVQPDIIITPFPAIDSHSDHKFSTIALIEALKKMNYRNGFLYLYTNHHTLNDFYPYGSQNSKVDLPPNFNKNLYFDSIYSHKLSIDDQKNKILSLEAMNDLRLDTEWLSLTGMTKEFAKILTKKILGWDRSYFRRAIRDNELFFIVKIENIYNDDIQKSIIGH